MLLENLLPRPCSAPARRAIALWGTQALRPAPISGALPIRFQTEVDRVGLAVAVWLGMLCALAAAATPAWQLSRLDPQDALAPAPARRRAAPCARR